MSVSTKSSAASGHHESHDLIVSNSIPLTTNTGFEFHVRPVQSEDREALRKFFANVSKEDLRFRFLSGLPEVSNSILDDMINVDHEHKEDYIAFDIDDKTIVASAMIGANADRSEAEVAIVVHSDYKHRGMSWTFLEYVAGEARRSGIKKLQSIESRQNHAAIELEREMGFTAKSYPGDATLMLLEFDLASSNPDV
ncbi:GNAT family N-acetyltransferase [Parasphingorhabdus cellanae]|uniref:GNAT family N-acetyltransferase n=1 Tax=Parasphingorhabdus cellanae TaxID=2806553 RepID=A0ABX7T3U2_9SPHN|nr:GNAT family N-acetyltransferase [Parasphingorhabdus cellanae]QTD55796.1 GNAT family N-acetyltransferase [Parasphingorhabdus cellanae]